MADRRDATLRNSFAVRRGLILLALIGTLAAALLIGVAPADLLFVAPGMLIAVALTFGRYVGEGAITAWRTAVAGTRRARATRQAPRPSTAVLLPRGGRLVAARLAGRAPPALLVLA
jgi:hypothetical protein